MAYDFNIDEVLEMAEQIERNGVIFYRRMADGIGDQALADQLNALAKMEKNHEKTFQSMRKDLSTREKAPTLFDPEGEAVLYLRALADLRVFDREAEEAFALPEGLSLEEKMEKVLREAIHREKESIVFYLGLKELVGEKMGRDKIDPIIKEEMKHIRLLNNNLARQN